MNTLGEQLRKQASQMMAAAKKLLEAADVLDGPAVMAPEVTAPAQQHLTLKVKRHISRKKSHKDLIVGVLSQSESPLSRTEILSKLHEAGEMLDKKAGDISTYLTRLYDGGKGKITKSDGGKWTVPATSI